MTTHSSKGKLLSKEGQFEHYKKLIQFSYVTFHFEVLHQLYQLPDFFLTFQLTEVQSNTCAGLGVAFLLLLTSLFFK